MQITTILPSICFYYPGFVAFLDKGVGVESSEKLMKELADPSSRLGIPRPKKQP